MTRKPRKVCSVEGCTNASKTRGWCIKHYGRWYQHGDPLFTLTTPPNSTFEDRLRFYGWTITDSGCWEYNGFRESDGYGRVITKNKSYQAHRVAYELWVGPIPEGLLVRHFVCDNRSCINPAHLLVGTHKDNTQDMIRAGRKPVGEDFYDSKLTVIQVREIRELYAQGTSGPNLAKTYGVGPSSIYKIIHRRTWKNV